MYHEILWVEVIAITQAFQPEGEAPGETDVVVVPDGDQLALREAERRVLFVAERGYRPGTLTTRTPGASQINSCSAQSLRTINSLLG